ncbi:MAG: SBBP repeat-containing protein [Promethearchaeota archaeon]
MKNHLKKRCIIFFGTTLIILCGFLFNNNANIKISKFNSNNNNINIASPPSFEQYYTWGGSGNDIGFGVALDAADNVYVSGYTESFGALSQDMCLVKFNLNGVEWNHTWGGSGDESGNDVALDSVGNAYVAGQTSSFGAINYDLCLVKFNSTGVEWNHTWGGSGDDHGRSVALDSGSNAFVSGYTESFGAINYDLCLVKFNSTGVEWNRTWGGGGYDIGFGVALDSAGNAYVAGYTGSFGAVNNDLCLVKFNSTGGVEWNSTWGGAGTDVGHDVALDSAGNAYVAGYTYSFGAILRDLCLVKFNSTGSVEWNYTWGGTGHDYGAEVVLDSSGNIYVAGSTNSFGVNGYETCLIKFNSTGVEWNRTWGGSEKEEGNDLVLDASGNIYVAGFTESFGAINSDILLVKFRIQSSNDGSQIPDILFFIIIGIIIGGITGGTGIAIIIIVGKILPRKKRARVSKAT